MRSLKGLVAGVILILVTVAVLSLVRTEQRSVGPIQGLDEITGGDRT